MNKTLQRKLGLPLVTFYGLGTIVGAGIYILIGEVANIAGQQVEQWMLKLMNDCKRENVLEHSSLRRWIEDFCWLLSPLL